MNFFLFQLISSDINNCEINCFQKRKSVFELRTYLLFFVDLLASLIGEKSHIFFNDV